MAKPIMIQGTMSNAGKSLIAAGLCRVFRQDGRRVAPFKAQNMALNSFITREGLEMGRAQVVQAEAAGVEPSVLMNPILLKPTNDMGSQIIVHGEVWGQMSAREYFAVKRQLLPEVMKAYDALSAQNDVIVIEGAGSPAEINLKNDDVFVNMGMARASKAPRAAGGGHRPGRGLRSALRHRGPSRRGGAGHGEGRHHQQVPGGRAHPDPRPPAAGGAYPHPRGGGGTLRGMGLLPVKTVFTKEKTRTRVTGAFGDVGGVLSALSRQSFEGYEIHMGESTGGAPLIGFTNQLSGEERPDGCQQGSVYGTYVHGILDQDQVAGTIVRALAERKGVDPALLGRVSGEEHKQREYDRLAQTLREHMDMKTVYRILEEGIA